MVAIHFSMSSVRRICCRWFPTWFSKRGSGTACLCTGSPKTIDLVENTVALRCNMSVVTWIVVTTDSFVFFNSRSTINSGSNLKARCDSGNKCFQETEDSTRSDSGNEGFRSQGPLSLPPIHFRNFIRLTTTSWSFRRDQFSPEEKKSDVFSF